MPNFTQNITGAGAILNNADVVNIEGGQATHNNAGGPAFDADAFFAALKERMPEVAPDLEAVKTEATQDAPQPEAIAANLDNLKGYGEIIADVALSVGPGLVTLMTGNPVIGGLVKLGGDKVRQLWEKG